MSRPKMASFVLLLGLFFATIPTITIPTKASATACGLSDTVTHATASVARPQKGASYIDPAFSCTVTRLSDGAAEGTGSVFHQYSSVNPFNATSTRVLLDTPNGAMQIRDLSGTIVRNNLYIYGIVGMGNPFWSRSNPDLIYFHTVNGNQLKSYNVATNAVTTLYTFANYSQVSFGLGEGDISADSDHLPVVGDGRYGFIHTISTHANTQAVDLLRYGGWLDNVDVTPQNRFTLIHTQPEAVQLFDSQLNSLGAVLDYAGHSDRGRDTDGSDMVVITNSNDYSPIANCQNGIVKKRLPSGTESCMQSLDWSLIPHISCNNIGQDWCLVSTYGGAAGTPYSGEILKIKLDGSQTLRLAQAHSSNNDYYSEPRAAVSPDGRYALFDSNFGGGATDVYLLALPDIGTVSAAAATPAPTPQPAPAPSAPTLVSSAITWASLRNAALSGSTLRKSAGCNGCEDSGAISSEQIPSGNGYAEFSVAQTGTMLAAGLSNGNTNTTVGDIDFALLLNGGGYAEVREGGVYRADTSYRTGDVFRITVENNRVTYKKNGTIFYTSSATPRYPLLMDSSFLSSSASLTLARIAWTR